jgi:predicted lipoprotein with Yx(FWY)xxD motif
MTDQDTFRQGRARLAARRGRWRAPLGQGRHRWRLGWLAPAAVIAAALIVAACGSSSAGGVASAPPGTASSAASSGSALETTTISGAAVVTDARGFTLYSFAPDTATTSKCAGSCAQIWPPVKGPVTAGQGVPGKLGTIARSDGATQATYDGHPLYTYAGDTHPGQANGNNLNLNGGLWHEVPAGAGPP